MSPTEIGSRRAQARRCHRSTFLLCRTASALALTGCSYSPTQDLFGSYFPAWMLCAAIGIATAIMIRRFLGVSDIHGHVVAPLFTYTALAVSATLLAWLLWFGH